MRLIKLFAGNLAEDLAGLLGGPHVAFDQPAIRLADFRDRLAGGEVDDLVVVERS